MNKLLPAALLAALTCMLATAALAAQPKSPGSYGGTFKGGKGYVSFFVKQGGAIRYARVQYTCKGKSAAIETSPSFDPVRVSGEGRFVIKYKGDVLDEQFKKTGKVGRVRISGRFRKSTVARGKA